MYIDTQSDIVIIIVIFYFEINKFNNEKQTTRKSQNHQSRLPIDSYQSLSSFVARKNKKLKHRPTAAQIIRIIERINLPRSGKIYSSLFLYTMSL